MSKARRSWRTSTGVFPARLVYDVRRWGPAQQTCSSGVVDTYLDRATLVAIPDTGLSQSAPQRIALQAISATFIFFPLR